VTVRLLLIGIDGATAEVLGPAMDGGLMPHLSALRARGWMTGLQSTLPAATAPAWATFMTGVTPRRHGILDFLRYDRSTGRVRFVHAGDLQVATLWAYLSRADVVVGVVNLPLTYPPPPVRGFLVAGLLTPSLDTVFTHPASLAREVLARFPRYRIVAAEQQTGGSRERLLAEAGEEFAVRAAAAEWLVARYRPDVVMVQFQSLDPLQHRFWPEVCAATAGAGARDLTGALRALDEAVGRVAALADGAPVLVLSDHGFTGKVGTLYPNRLLGQWGLLRPRGRGPFARLRSALRRAIRACPSPDAAAALPEVIRARSRRAGVLSGRGTVARHLHGDLVAAIYLSGGAGPGSAADPPAGSLADRLAAGFVALTDREGRRVVQAAGPGEAFAGPLGPEVVVVPEAGWVCSRRADAGPPLVPLAQGGTHAATGILLGAGLPLPPSPPRLQDLTPTVLGLLGLPLPDGLDGVPLFGAPEGAAASVAAGRVERVMSPEEEQAVAAQLRALGYLQ